MPDCQNKESEIKELTDLYEVPFKVKEILQQHGNVCIDCRRLLLDDHTFLLGDNLAPFGLCPSLWIYTNEAPEIKIVLDQSEVATTYCFVYIQLNAMNCFFVFRHCTNRMDLNDIQK